MAKHDEHGREIPDTTPLEIPLTAQRPEPMSALIARMVRNQVDDVAEKNHKPSFEEEDDFHDPTEELDEQMMSPYTVNEVEMQAIGPENDLDGSDGDSIETGGHEAPQEFDANSGAPVASEATNAEAPKE